MGKSKANTKKVPTRTTLNNRVGKSIPSSKVKSYIKSKLSGKPRMQKYVEVMLCSVVEDVLVYMLSKANKNVKGEKKIHIKANHMEQVINEEGKPLGNLFPTHIAGLH